LNNIQARKEYKIIEGQEERVFNLVLKNTLDKNISWEFGRAMWIGKQRNNKLMFYKGEVRNCIVVQNPKEYIFFHISDQQEELLRGIITSKGSLKIEDKKKILNSNSVLDYYDEVAA